MLRDAIALGEGIMHLSSPCARDGVIWPVKRPLGLSLSLAEG